MLELRKKTDLTKPWRTRLVVRTLRYPYYQSKQSGFTIVEALMAIIVTTALMVAIAPVVSLSVGVRVQARRVDLATQAARSYIDGLRANAFDPPSLTRGVNFNSSNAGSDLGVRAPSAMRQFQGVEQCLDKNLNSVNCFTSNPLLVIQAFRNGPTDSKEAVAQGYCVGVRVYRADAFQGSSAPTRTLPTKSAATINLDSKNYPLVVMKTQIINQTSFNSYKNSYSNSGNPCG